MGEESKSEEVTESRAPFKQADLVQSFDIPQIVAFDPEWKEKYYDPRYEYKCIAKDRFFAQKVHGRSGWEVDPHHPDTWHDLKLCRRPIEMAEEEARRNAALNMERERTISRQALVSAAKPIADALRVPVEALLYQPGTNMPTGTRIDPGQHMAHRIRRAGGNRTYSLPGQPTR